MIRSYLHLVAVDPGFSRKTVTFSVRLDEHDSKPEAQAAFLHRFLQRLQSLPGVKAAGASSHLPLSQSESVTEVEIRGVGRPKEVVEARSVTPRYREALGTQLLKGRDFNVQDAARPNVVMVNEQFTKVYFKALDPIGGQLRTGVGDLAKTPWSTVIGVVGGVRHNKLEEKPIPQILQPTESADNFAIASDLPPAVIFEEARTVLHGLDPALALNNPATMQQRINASNSRRNFQTALLTGFAAIATALVLAGLYGLIAYSVKTRTAEIGIRLAIGSSRGRIAMLILRQGLRVTLTGLLIGLILSFAILRTISAWLFGVTATDPLTFMLVTLFVLVIASLACVIPTLAAAKIEPAVALRVE
jgi:predicted permease